MALVNPAPPWPVALSLSGGGFRAAGFHLGALALLDEVGLLERVGALSTVSGGTLVGASWALSRARGRPFPEFYADFSGWLARADVMGAAFARLIEPGGRARPSLIRAAADVYDAELFGGAVFGELLDSDRVPTELSFNATEFDTGVAFRFVRSASPGARIGNGNRWIPREQAARLRVADIAAASSCFPGGFEPLVLPDDLGTPIAWDGPPLALMDGGIVDNQGVEALLLTRVGRPDPGLLVISDTSQPSDSFYPGRSPVPRGGPRLKVAWWAAEGGAWGTAALLGSRALVEAGTDQLALGALDLALAGGVGGLAWAMRWTRRELARRLAEGVPGASLAALAELTVPEALGVVDVRARSLLALTGNVSMKRIRQLVYQNAYRDETVKGRRISNLIYRMPQKSKTRERLAALGLSTPDALGLSPVVDAAVAMPTTLWWTASGQREAVIRCGYASMAFHLLEHLDRRYGADRSAWPGEVREVWDRAEARWTAGARPPGQEPVTS